MAEEVVSLVAKLEDNVSNAAYRVIKALDDIGDKARSASPKVKALEAATDEEANAAKNAAAANYLNAKAMGKMGKEALKAEIKMRLLERRLKKMARAGAGRGRGRAGGGGGPMMAAGVGGMPLTMAIFAASTVAALLPALSAAIGAVGAAALGAVGALAPLSGLLIAYPGLLAALGQGLVVTKMAFQGVGDAVKVLNDPGSSLSEINEAMAKLGPNGQQFARTVSGLKGDFDEISRGVQEALLPSFNALANTASSYLPMIRAAFMSTASAVKETVNSFGGFLQETRTQEQIGQVLSNNVRIVRAFGAAGVSGSRILLDLLEAAGPLLVQISRDIAGFLQQLSMSTRMNTSGLRDFFESTYVVLRKTLKVTSDFAAAIYNIASVGVPLGSAMGDSFLKMAQNFRAFTESEEGISKISNWFAEMTPVVYELGYLLRDIGKAFFGIGSDGEAFINISKSVREELLPIFVEFTENVSENLIPTILELIKSFAEFITAIDPLRFIIPILRTVAEMFGAVAAAINALGPVGKFVIGVIVAMMFTIKSAILVLNLFRVAKLRAALAARTLGTSIRTMMISAGAVGAVLAVAGTALAAFGGGQDETAQKVDSLTEALRRQSTEGMRPAVEELVNMFKDTDIRGESFVKRIEEMGFTLDEFVTAVLDGPDAIKSLIKRMREWEDSTGAVRGPVMDMVHLLWETRGAFEDASLEAKVIDNALISLGYSTQDTANDFNNLGNELTETKTAADRLSDAMKALDDLLNKRATKRAYFKSLRELQTSLKENGDNFDVLTEKGMANEAALDEVFSQAFQRADQAIKEGNLPKALQILETSQQDLRDLFVDAFGKDEGNKLADNALGPLLDKINIVKTELGNLSREQFTIKVGYQGAQQIPGAAFTTPLASGPEARFAGGPIVGGRTYMVGELGPEAFIGKNGNVSLIGKNGPEVTRFPQGGYVVPNHVLGGARDSSVPTGVMNALAGAVQTKGASGGSGEYEMGDRPINIHIGSIQQATEFDVAKAIKKGILEAERNRRERS